MYDKGGAVDKENKILRVNIVKIKQEEIFGRAQYIFMKVTVTFKICSILSWTDPATPV